jgi:hypothetical protein
MSLAIASKRTGRQHHCPFASSQKWSLHDDGAEARRVESVSDGGSIKQSSTAGPCFWSGQPKYIVYGHDYAGHRVVYLIIAL